MTPQTRLISTQYSHVRLLTLQFVTTPDVSLTAVRQNIHPGKRREHMVISFLNLMANRKAETICACLHFSCYKTVTRCLHEHVATLRDLFPLVRESVVHFLFFPLCRVQGIKAKLWESNPVYSVCKWFTKRQEDHGDPARVPDSVKFVPFWRWEILHWGLIYWETAVKYSGDNMYCFYGYSQHHKYKLIVFTLVKRLA